MQTRFSKFFLVPVAMAAAALATTAASAEATVKVPFSFTVAGKICPAGVYIIQKNIGSHLVTLKSDDSRSSFRWAVGPGNPAPTDGRVVLNFDESGSTHTLRSVQYGTMITSALDKNAKPTASERTRTLRVE